MKSAVVSPLIWFLKKGETIKESCEEVKLIRLSEAPIKLKLEDLALNGIGQ